VVAPGSPGLAEVVETFGTDVLTDGGTLDRAALARIVFADPAALAALNAITHPRIAERRRQIIAGLPPDAVVVEDIPLLAESALDRRAEWELIIVVDAPDDVRLDRLVKRGLTVEDARQRMGRQATRAARIAIADVVIDNSGDEADLRERVRDVWATRIAPGSSDQH
jgi:dephospho-CoA kinase